jgi:hypothetical protein
MSGYRRRREDGDDCSNGHCHKDYETGTFIYCKLHDPENQTPPNSFLYEHERHPFLPDDSEPDSD